MTVCCGIRRDEKRLTMLLFILNSPESGFQFPSPPPSADFMTFSRLDRVLIRERRVSRETTGLLDIDH